MHQGVRTDTQQTSAGSTVRESLKPPALPEEPARSLPTLPRVVLLTALAFPLAGIPALFFLSRRSLALSRSLEHLHGTVSLLDREMTASVRQQQVVQSSLKALDLKLEQIESQMHRQSEQYDQSNIALRRLRTELRLHQEAHRQISTSLADTAGFVEQMQRGLGLESSQDDALVGRLRDAAMRLEKTSRSTSSETP
ncbi:hypothetical protein DL96DRAFT_1593942 [Flagelloscypha sp. PMI_526]|nr:hypothetical protein DL96DRAFT_1593942 [Flagelloscypha sp. PMI_526]